ncbi:MAG: RluA family pseudouridine synthase [Eubacterium sp.]|nr:RluA family pseudouridine synthase [Eubacterium sp.]
MDNVFIVEETADNIRIDKYLKELLPDQSRSYIQKLLKEGHILVNNSICKPNYKVNGDDRITIDIPEPVEANIKPENIPLDIIYEDKDVIIINKPKEMVVHPAPGNYSGTLVNGLMYHCKDTLSNINGVLRPGIVHRIDKNTTGCLIVCKNDQAHNFIADQLSEHSINRIYTGIVYGVLKDDEGTIDEPIARDKRDRKRMGVNRDGKRAITHYKVLKRFRDYTYVQFKLETGRTHQIRVHMAHINHPLLGDDQYTNRKCKFNLTGQCLHAKTIGFIHPSTKEYIEYEVEEPEYFKHLLDILEE